MTCSPPSSPLLPTFKGSHGDDNRKRWKLSFGSDSANEVAPKNDEPPSVLDPSEELLGTGILKDKTSVKISCGAISWRDSKHLAHKSAIANTARTSHSEGTALLTSNVDHHPMAPPLKKRLGSKHLLGRDTPTLSRNDVNFAIPTPTFNHPARVVAVKREAMQTPQVGMRFLDGSGTDSKQSQTRESIGTGQKLISQPLMRTPHPSMYYRNLAANSARPIPTPFSSVRNRGEFNLADINQSQLSSFHSLDNPREFQAPLSMTRPHSRNGSVTFQDSFRAQSPSFHALNRRLESSGQGPSFSSARPSSRNANVSFQHALQASFPFHEAQGSIPFPYATAPPIAPMSLTEALTRFTGSHANGLSAHGPPKREAPTEITNIPMHSKAPMFAQIYHAPEANPTYARSSTFLPQMRSVIAASDHPNEKTVSGNKTTANPTSAEFKQAENFQPMAEPLILATKTTSDGADTAPFIANQVALAYLSNSTNNHTYNRGCTCKNSKCLKLYCKCFQGGQFCDSRNCNCNDCHNSPQHDGPHGVRRKVIWETLARRPDAFFKRPTKRTGEGCACKKTQ